MRRVFDQPFSWRSRVVAALLSVHLLVLVALAASPALHQWLHPAAGHHDHECAVVTFQHGSTDETPAPVFTGLPQVWQEREITGGESAVLPALRLGGHALEHAPPFPA